MLRIRTTLTLLLLLSAAASAQDLNTALSAVVRISGTRNDTPVRGTGFLIALDRDRATILTASHVIEGVRGGSFVAGLAGLRSASRAGFRSMDRNKAIGFRCARSSHRPT